MSFQKIGFRRVIYIKVGFIVGVVMDIMMGLCLLPYFLPILTLLTFAWHLL